MNKLKCYITKRYNGLYLVTAINPKIVEVTGTGHKDAYIRYGDPIGYINISKQFITSVFGDADDITYTPRRIQLYGSIYGDTHFVEYDDELKLYSIHHQSKSHIDYVCEWFVKTMFNIISVKEDMIQPVHFSGELL